MKLLGLLLIVTVVLVGTTSCKRHFGSSSPSSNTNSNKKPESSYDQLVKNSPNSKVYLFDYIKTVENKLNENGVNKSLPSSKDSIDWAKFYSQRTNQSALAAAGDQKAYDYELEQQQPSPTECRLSSRTIGLKLGRGCRKIQYPLVSCVGYCSSQSMLWKHNWGHGFGAKYLEVNTVECCSVSHVWQRVQRVYCLERLEPKDIRNDFYGNLKDTELIKLFQESFTESKWTDSKKVIDKELYAGYFSILVAYNATCECQQIELD